MKTVKKVAAMMILGVVVGMAAEVRAQTGTCAPALGESLLDVNNVRAQLFNNGNLFWRTGGSALYEVPKGQGVSALFTSGLWIGGTFDGQLRVAAARYSNHNFWGGPLDDNGNPPADCSVYDRLYKVSRRDLTEYDATGQATADLRDWPTGLGAPTLAPPGNGLDDDGDGETDEDGEQIDLLDRPLAQRLERIIDLAAGERPAIQGDQSVWWIMNDRGNQHLQSASDTPPIGLEVHAMAFAFDTAGDAFDNTTFYEYTFFLKGNTPLENTYVGLFSDPDLGNFADDWVGADTLLGLGYVYNADNVDESGFGYGTPPPALGYDFIQGPIVPAPGDTAFFDGGRLPDFRNLQMTHFLTFNSGGGVTSDPSNGADYYNYLKGLWKDGQPITEGGNGRSFSQIPTAFMFPGDATTCSFWTECDSDGAGTAISPADRRFVMSSGPFTLTPGEAQQILVGIIWAHGTDNFDSVTQLRAADAEVQAAFAAGFETVMTPSTDPPAVPVALASPADGATGQPTNPALYWQAIPAIGQYEAELATDAAFTLDVTRLDAYIPSFHLAGLVSQTTYFWRVRAVNTAGFGPWSEVWRFSTSDVTFGIESVFKDFQVVANAAGPLDPPDYAAFSFNNSGFPDPSGSERGTPGRQQSTNDAVWGFHAGGANTPFGPSTDTNSFLGRITRNGNTLPNILSGDYEMRFSQRCVDTPADCLAYRAFSDATFMEVPFELWHIGRDTPDDASDDYRLVPLICDTNTCRGGTVDGVFDIGSDHPISGGVNDPLTDWTYWHRPSDISPGEAGYLAYVADPNTGSEEIFARIVLVQWNGAEAPPYDPLLPETGTVFRIVTGPLQAPILATPADGTTIAPPSVTFYWNANLDDQTFQLQVATDENFNAIIEEVTGLTDRVYPFAGLDPNAAYFWRVRSVNTDGAELSPWSATWRFTTGASGTVAVEALDGAVPETYELGANYPNPFNPTTQIEFGLPKATHVQLEIYDVLGRVVARLVDGQLPAGYHRATWAAQDKASGVYLYRLTAASFVETRVMVLVR